MTTTSRTVTALSLILAAGLANAQRPDTSTLKPDVGARISGVATPVTLSSAQRAAITSAFNLSQRDLQLLQGPIAPSTVFTEVIGYMERTNQLNVGVKSLDAMIDQELTELRDLAQSLGQNLGATQARAAIDGAQTLDITYADVVARAEQRMINARERLAPSLHEAFDDVDMHTINLPEGVSAETAAEILMRTGDYEYASINWLCYPTDTVPNDTQLGQQYYHDSDYMDSFGAWDITTGSGEIIAICDTGGDLNHPDLNFLPGYNAATNLAQVDGGNVNDINGHGSFCAGAAAAIGNNGTGVSGMGWNFQVIPARVTNNGDGTAPLSDILEGARWSSDNGAYAVNCSYGGSQDPATNSSGNHIRNEGHHLVFSAGNFGLNDQQNDWENVLIVGASNVAGNWASWSHTGPGVDCVAPGSSVYTTNRFGGYGFVDGTSFSAPITAGALALIRSANPSLSADDVELLLLTNADDIRASGEDNETGWGRVNVGRAVADALDGPDLIPVPFSQDFTDSTLLRFRDITGTVATSADATNEPSGDESLRMQGASSARTVDLLGSGLLDFTPQITFYTQTDGVEAGESLTVEYFDIFGNWETLGTITSNGSDAEQFSKHRFETTFFMYHDAFKLRFTTDGDQSNDVWFIDDLQVNEFTGNFGEWSDDFEDGLSPTFDWASSAGVQTNADADNEPSGTMSANLDNADQLTSQPVDFTDELSGSELIWARFFSQHKGVEAGKTLTAEFKDLFGNWQTFATVTSDGSDQSDFEFTQVQLSFFAVHPDLQIRFTVDGDASDEWYIDDVALSKFEIEEPASCPVDLDGSGSLNFGDVTAFLTLYGMSDPAADLDNSGSLNFGDVTAFLTLYGQGCP